jgi:hypothetical protein
MRAWQDPQICANADEPPCPRSTVTAGECFQSNRDAMPGLGHIRWPHFDRWIGKRITAFGGSEQTFGNARVEILESWAGPAPQH